MMDAFREHRLRRTARPAVTIGRAIRAGRVRAKMAPAQVPHVEGAALRDVLADVAADAQLVAVTINRPHWSATDVHAAAGDQVTWLAWGR
jgi:hypothetical protein